MSAKSRDEYDETVILNTQSGDSDGTRTGEMADTHKLQESSLGSEASGPDGSAHESQLGHYRLERLLGQGGMGSVFLGVDERDGRRVAVKRLSPGIVPDEDAVRRFQKEARLLANVHHPHIANLLDVGEDAGTCYLVLEFVDGVDLKWLLSRHAPLTERMALLILRDVTEALAAAHRQGIIHRDMKPSNILMAAASDDAASSAEAVSSAVISGCRPDIKLTDFGLARHMDQSASLDLTRTGQILGTPIYMAPEQCTSSGNVGPGTDVYALGVTLFEMLAGRPPFKADDLVKMISLHSSCDPPDLRKFNPSVSDGTAQLVHKMLGKVPDERHVDAGHLLEEIERLLRGETNDVSIHPRTPQPGAAPFTADWEWNLQASPEQLWPLVSNTERINCVVGVPAVEYTTDRDEFNAVRKFGTFRLGWATMKWEEHPFEWVEGRRLGVLREFQRGPFEWFLSIVELAPRPGGGTRLTHSVRIVPHGLLGRLLAHLEVNVKGRKTLDRVYDRIDAVASGRLKGSPTIDPFAPPSELSKSSQRRLEARREKLQRTSVDVECEEKLARFLADSPSQELARIRPYELARRMGVRPELMSEACLSACQVGLLELHWDILCPTCRISSTIADTLGEIERHAFCEACDLDFEVDFGSAVELIFRVHPEVREADLKTYCIGGPEHAPHVLAQVRMAVDERLELDLVLDPGVYILRGPQLPYTVRLVAQSGGAVSRTDVVLSKFLVADRVPAVQAGRLLLTLENKYDRPLLLRIERTIPRGDVLSAAAACRMPLFRDLFPGEVSPEQLSDVSTSTLLAARVANSADLFDEHGDSAALRMMRHRLGDAHETIEAAGGDIVREQDDRLLSVFRDAPSALQSALQLASFSAAKGEDEDRRLALRIALHCGTTLTTTIDGRLDYVGRTVNTVGELIESDSAGALVLTEEIFADAEVQSLLSDAGLTAQRRDISPVRGADVYEITASSTDAAI